MAQDTRRLAFVFLRWFFVVTSMVSYGPVGGVEGFDRVESLCCRSHKGTGWWLVGFLEIKLLPQHLDLNESKSNLKNYSFSTLRDKKKENLEIKIIEIKKRVDFDCSYNSPGIPGRFLFFFGGPPPVC